MSRGRTFLLNQLGSSNGAGGVTNGVAYFTAPFTIGSESAFTYDPSTDLLTVPFLTLNGASAVLTVAPVSGPGSVLIGRGSGGSGGRLDFVATNGDASAVRFIGLSGGSGNYIAGSVASDMVSRLPSGKFLWSVDGGTTAEFVVKDTAVAAGVDDAVTLGEPSVGWKQVYAAYTDTSGGVTGNRTINKMAGSVNFAAGMSTVVVTNSVVTTSSKVFAAISTSGSSGVIGSVVPGSGSFAIVMSTNPAAETRVQWFVLSTN